jgi:hypothetical protein
VDTITLSYDKENNSKWRCFFKMAAKYKINIPNNWKNMIETRFWCLFLYISGIGHHKNVILQKHNSKLRRFFFMAANYKINIPKNDIDTISVSIPIFKVNTVNGHNQMTVYNHELRAKSLLRHVNMFPRHVSMLPRCDDEPKDMLTRHQDIVNAP